MPQKAGFPTDHPELDAVLLGLLDQVKEALGESFVGLYLYGSLATGGFMPSRSDIDFLVVTRGELSPAQIAALEAVHQRLWSSGSKWAAKLEGMYLPIQRLRRHDPSGPAIPTVNEGRFYLAQEDSDWVIQRHVIRETEAIVEGPSIRDRIDPISPDDLRAAVTALLRSWWAPMLGDPSRLNSPGYKAYAVLSMCRAMYLHETGAIVSKEDAAAWALTSLPRQWGALVSAAIAWREGDAEPSLTETLAFIEYAVATASREWPSIQAVTPTICELLGIPAPALCDSAPLPDVLQAAREAFNGASAEKCLIFAPDAIGNHLFKQHPGLRVRAIAAAPIAVSLRSVLPPITPVAFASMFTGAEPAQHGIQEGVRPVLKCDTLFDALVRAGKRVAVVAVTGSSIERMYRERDLDYFAEEYDPQVTARTISLLEADEHDFIVAYLQEYDDTTHKHGPFAAEAVQAAENNVAAFVRIAAAFDTHWARYNRAIAFTPDHGAHLNPRTGKGSHGDDIAEDMELTHFFGLRAAASGP